MSFSFLRHDITRHVVITRQITSGENQLGGCGSCGSVLSTNHRVVVLIAHMAS